MEVIALATYYHIVLVDRIVEFALIMTKTQQEALTTIFERASMVTQVSATLPRLSKVVKLRVRILPELPREMSLVRNGSTRHVSQPSDIDIEPLGSELEEMPNSIGQQDAVVASVQSEFQITRAANMVVANTTCRTLQVMQQRCPLIATCIYNYASRNRKRSSKTTGGTWRSCDSLRTEHKRNSSMRYKRQKRC